MTSKVPFWVILFRMGVSPFPTMFSTLPKLNFNFSLASVLSSANAFNLVSAKKLLFGNELNQFGKGGKGL